LLAEDNEYNRIVATETLQLKVPGIQIETVVNGVEVVNLLRNKKNDPAYYDLILMDVQMPLMDGYETTQLIRKEFDPPLKNIPIIALTASVLRSDIEKCLKAGMNGYIAKPFRSSELIIGMYKAIKPASAGSVNFKTDPEITTSEVPSSTKIT
jgi:CheY-like chemotaxis protein